MNDNNLEQRINNAPEEISELFVVLSTEDDSYLETFGEGLSNANFLMENQTEVITKAFSVAFSLSPLFEFEHTLKDIGYKTEDIDLIVKNYKETFLPVFNEYNHLAVEEDVPGDVKAELKKTVNANSMSHTDILSEIENPTPSMSTTGSFAKKTNQAIPTSGIKNATQPDADNEQKVEKTAQATPDSSKNNNVELGGFSTANHQNPAQKVVTKLNQQLTGPTSSIPKEVYVSKKLDPYKEPLA